MDAAHGAAAPALSKLSSGIREYSLFQGVLRVLDRLRAAHPELALSDETIDFNIVDQFVERESDNYLTGMQIRIVGRR